MALSDPIKIRLREGQALVYAAQAEQQGLVSLPTYGTALITPTGFVRSLKAFVLP